MLKLDLESRKAGCSTFLGPQGLYSVASWSKCQVENQLCIFTPKERQEKIRKVRDDINRWRDIPCSWVGRINIVKMTLLPNAIYRFNAIPTKLAMAFFTELEQKISQFMWKHKRPWIAKAVLRKKSGAGGSSFLTSGYTTKLQSSTQCVVLAHTRNTDQWSKTESPETNPCTCGTLFLTKEATIYNGPKPGSSINGAGKTGQLRVKSEIRILPNTMHKDKLKMN